MTTMTNYPDEIVSAGQLLRILDSDAREISTLCQKACLKPKKDGFGNIYFSKGDVDVLRKVKELYEHTKRLQDERSNEPVMDNSPVIRESKLKLKPKAEKIENRMNDLDAQAESFLAPKLPSKSEMIIPTSQSTIIRKIDSMENNVITRITDVLSEKLDGLDEVIVELIKAKTENETLRQKVNELNKENFALKSENASYKSVGLGLYVKKSTDDFTF